MAAVSVKGLNFLHPVAPLFRSPTVNDTRVQESCCRRETARCHCKFWSICQQHDK